MSPEKQKYEETPEQKNPENQEQNLKKQNIKPENSEIVKKLGFHLEKGESINQKTLEGKMGEQFNTMKNSVGNNPESQAKFDAIQKSFSQTIGTETDINKQLELCAEFLKEYDIAASTEKGEYSQRAKMQSENMEKEAKTNTSKIEEKYSAIKKMITEITELQAKESTRKNEEKQKQATLQNAEKSSEVASAGTALNLPDWPGSLKA